MAYFCKKCHLPIFISLQNGVVEMAVESGDKLVNVDKCPICNKPLTTRKDLKYVPPKEVKT